MRMIAMSLGAKKLPTYEECITVDTEPEMTQEEVAQQRRKLLDGLNAG